MTKIKAGDYVLFFYNDSKKWLMKVGKKEQFHSHIGVIKHADAIGKEPIEPPNVPVNPTTKEIEKVVWEQLKTCYDPEIPINVVDLGLIYSCEIQTVESNEYMAKVEMTLTAPGCGMGDILMQDVKEKIEIVPNIREANVELVFDPPWNQSMMSETAQLEAGLL